jgi:hypothetical protein
MILNNNDYDIDDDNNIKDCNDEITNGCYTSRNSNGYQLGAGLESGRTL